MTEVNIFSFTDYKDYIQKKIEKSPMRGRGLKKELASHLGCQPTYVSRILKGIPDFSLEQAIKVNSFFSHTKIESRYFILLVEYSKAGSYELKEYFKEQIDEMQNRYIVYRTREYDEVDFEDHVVYYSQWYYSAIHMLTGLEGFKTSDAICARLGLAESTVQKVLEFLESKNMVSFDGEKYSRKVSSLYAKASLDSYHASWRNKAISQIGACPKTNSFTSAILTLCKDDVSTIRNILRVSLEKCVDVIKASEKEGKEENDLMVVNLDVFKV